MMGNYFRSTANLAQDGVVTGLSAVIELPSPLPVRRPMEVPGVLRLARTLTDAELGVHRVRVVPLPEGRIHNFIFFHYCSDELGKSSHVYALQGINTRSHSCRRCTHNIQGMKVGLKGRQDQANNVFGVQHACAIGHVVPCVACETLHYWFHKSVHILPSDWS